PEVAPVPPELEAPRGPEDEVLEPVLVEVDHRSPDAEREPSRLGRPRGGRLRRRAGVPQPGGLGHVREVGGGGPPGALLAGADPADRPAAVLLPDVHLERDLDRRARPPGLETADAQGADEGRAAGVPRIDLPVADPETGVLDRLEGLGDPEDRRAFGG